MTKSRESKMLDEVRRWRKKAYDADRAKPASKRAKDAEELARKFDLPMIQARDAGAGRRP
jgi:hypothetical protein